MSFNINKFTIEELREAFKYDPTTGNLYRKRKDGEFHPIQNKPGYQGSLYATGKPRKVIDVKCYTTALKGVNLKHHHIAVVLSTGKGLPDGHVVDHIDGNPLNNKLENLRVITQAQNVRNRKARGYSMSANGKRYVSHIRANRKSIYLGTFDTKEEAIAAFKAATIKYYGEFARQ